MEIVVVFLVLFGVAMGSQQEEYEIREIKITPEGKK